jgi:hypothetical protein
VTISGTTPEKGLRVILERTADTAEVRYVGAIFLPDRRAPIELTIDATTGDVKVAVGATDGASLDRNDVGFVEQLGRQAFRAATQTPPEEGGGRFPRRIQRWRGPK